MKIIRSSIIRRLKLFSLNIPPITPMINMLFLAQAGLIAGLAGSIHCVGMCGGLEISSTKNFKDHLYYQTGRLLGYLLLAALVGFSSQAIQHFFTPLAHTIFGFLLGAFLIFIGIKSWIKINFHLPSFFPQALSKLNSYFPKSAFFVGLASFLLPCGLLYSVLASLLLVGNPLKAMFAISLFWMGSTPLLMLLPGTLKRGLEYLGVNPKTIYGMLFVIMGLISIGLKIYPLLSPNTAQHSCHSAALK